MMERNKPTFDFKVILAIIVVHFVKASMANLCLWCNDDLSKKFINCVTESPLFKNVDQSVVEDMESSIIAASQAMTKSSPSVRMELVNGLWIGEICEWMKMQPEFKNPEGAYTMTLDIINIMRSCYTNLVGESGEFFSAKIRKHFDFQLKDLNIPLDNEPKLFNSVPLQNQVQSSANSAALSAQNSNYQSANAEVPIRQEVWYQPSYIQPAQPNLPLQLAFNQNNANAIGSAISNSYENAPGQQTVTLSSVSGQQNYQSYNIGAPQQQPTFQASQNANQPFWNQQPYNNLQSPEQNSGAQPTISQSSADANAASLTKPNDTPYRTLPTVQQPVLPNYAFEQSQQNSQLSYLNSKINTDQGNVYLDITQNNPINDAPNSGFQQNYETWNIASNSYPNNDLNSQINGQNSSLFPQNQIRNLNDGDRNLSPSSLNPQQYNQSPESLQGKPNLDMHQQKKSNNDDDETSQAMTFAETIFVTLSQSKVFIAFFHEYISNNPVLEITYNIILNALNICGYSDIAKDIAKEITFSIKQIEENSSTLIYAEVISKILTIQFGEKGIIGKNPDYQAAYIAEAILENMEIFISQSYIKPSKNTDASAASGSSEAETTNDKITENSDPSSYSPQNNAQDFPNYPISNSYSYSNYDSQTIQRPVQIQQDDYDDNSQTTQMPVQQYDSYDYYNSYDSFDSSKTQDYYGSDSTTPKTQDGYDDSTLSTAPDYYTNSERVPKQNPAPGSSGYYNYFNNNGDDYTYSYNNQDFSNYPSEYQYPISKAVQRSEQQGQQSSQQLASDNQKSSENFDKRTQVSTAAASSSSRVKQKKPRNKIRRRNRKRKGQYQNNQAESRSNALAGNSQNDDIYPISSSKQPPLASISGTRTDVPNDYQNQDSDQVLPTISGGKSSESKENIEILMECAQKSMSSEIFNFDTFADCIAKLVKDAQLKHPEWKPQEAQTKMLFQAIVAMTKLLMKYQNFSDNSQCDNSQGEVAPNLAKTNLPNTSVEKINFIQSEQRHPSTAVTVSSTQPNSLTSLTGQFNIEQNKQSYSTIPQNNFNYYSTGQSNAESQPAVVFNNRLLEQINQSNQGNLEQQNTWSSGYQVLQNRQNQFPPLSNWISQQTVPQFPNGVNPNTMAAGNQPNLSFQPQGQAILSIPGQGSPPGPANGPINLKQNEATLPQNNYNNVGNPQNW